MEKASSSSSSENENLLIEEREEVMVSDKGPCLRKTHFLNPSVTSIDDDSVAEIPSGDQRLSVSSSELKSLFSRICFSGFWVPQRRFKSWLTKMEALHAPTWRKAGIFEAIKASAYNINKNPSLISSIAKKWCPETKSFIFPWGEATITLEDVMVLLGFSVLGSSVLAPLESSEMRDSVEKLKKARLEIMGTNRRVSQRSWISRFLGRGDQMEHEAFLALWLSHFVFPDTYQRSISEKNLAIAVRLARGERIALATPVLACLYQDLGEISRAESTQRLSLQSLFKLVQVWAWERFKSLRPETKEILKGEPRIFRWGGVGHITENIVSLSFDDFEWRPYTKPLNNWNPLRFYVEEAMWVTVDDNLEDEFVSFARCVRSSKLVGIGFVEDYYPNRVAMQFGLDQDLPGLVTYHRNFTEEDAWNDYNKCLDGVKLYMPSRLATTSVTARYRDWWLKSVSEFHGSPESNDLEAFKLSNTVDDDDDDNVPPKVIPLSQVLQKLGEGFPAKLRRCRTRRTAKNMRCEIKKDKSQVVKRLGEGFPAKLRRCRTGKTAKSLRRKISDGDDDDGSVALEFPLIQLFGKELVKRTNERLRNKRRKIILEDDENCSDDIAIAQRNGSGEKIGGDALGKRSRLEEDNNDSRTFRRFALGDNETVGPLEIEKMSEENDEKEGGSKAEKSNMVLNPSDENNSSDSSFGAYQGAVDMVVSPPETRQACDDELDTCGSYTDMIDDGANGDESSQGYKCVCPLDESNIQRKDWLVDDYVSGSEETMKRNGQLENIEKRNVGYGEEDVGNASRERRFQDLDLLALSIEERINQVERNLAWLKERRKKAAARLI